MHDLPAKQRQHGFDASNRLLGHGEIVVAEDRKVRVLARDERADVVVVEGKPGRALRIQAKRFDTRHLLAVVGQHARHVSSGRHVEEREPRIERRDVGRIRADAGADSGVHDAAERRPAAGSEVGPGLGAGAAAQFLERLQPGFVDALQVDDRPSQPVDRMLARDRSKRLEMEIVLLDRDGVLLQQPAMLGDHPGGGLELRRHRVGAADALAESRRPEQVVADGLARLAEVVEDARLDLLRRVGREHRPHADR